MVYNLSKIQYFETYNFISYLSDKKLIYGFMGNKKQKELKTWEINGFPIHIEYYDSKIIVKDDYGNKMKILKKDSLSIILNLIGSFRSD